jgi:hypothetical protein
VAFDPQVPARALEGDKENRRRAAEAGRGGDRKQAAIDWAELRSFNDESRFTVHTAAEVLFVFQDGEEVR